jgi:hypothetical protein
MRLDTEDIRQRMSNLSNGELLSIVTTHRVEYRQVAIDLASEELRQRNIPLPAIDYSQLNAAPQPSRSPMRSYMKSGGVLAAVYLLSAGGALYLLVAFGDGVSGSADLDVYGMAAIWLLTLPWSLVLLAFAWAFVHDPEAPFFVLFFAMCAGLNAYLIYRVAGALSRGTGDK